MELLMVNNLTMPCLLLQYVTPYPPWGRTSNSLLWCVGTGDGFSIPLHSMETFLMAGDTWTKADTAQARHYWEAYQQQHDLSARQGQTAGIDPVSGRIWFGPSAKAIVAQLAAEGLTIPLYFLRIGSDVYLRKGSQRC